MSPFVARGGVEARRVRPRGRDRAGGRGSRAAAAPQVAQRAARDPQQEEVEDGEEAELQPDRDGLEQAVRGHRSTSKRTSTVPTTMSSPGADRRRRADRTAVDLDAVRRAQVGDRPAVAAGGPDLGVAARDVGVLQDDVALAAAADDGAAGPDRHALALGDDHRPAAAGGPRLVELLLDARRRSSRPSSGRGRPARRRPARLVRAHHARLDAELAEREALVGAELDLRAADEREALAAGVLEQVGGELVDDLVLDALEALAVLRRQPDGVLVGDVGARHRHGLVLVHLAGQLAGDLDRPHLGAEDAAERAFDEAGELLSRLRRTLIRDGAFPSAGGETLGRQRLMLRGRTGVRLAT